jgi:bacillithiol system protein YtxJ
MNYQELTVPDQLDAIRRLSSESGVQAVAVFKHSTRCSISMMAWDRLRRQWNFDAAVFPFFYLDLINHRDISAALASDFGVEHESPQLLIIKNGRCIYHASHSDISVPELSRAMNL